MFGHRIALGHIAYIAIQDGAVVGWVWLSKARVVRDRWRGLRLQFAGNELYIYDLWVYPEYRASGAGALIVGEVLRELQGEEGARWVYGFVDRTNTPNQTLLRLVFGFRSVQSIKQVRLLNAVGRVVQKTAAPPEGPCTRRGLASAKSGRQHSGRPDRSDQSSK